MAAHSPSDSGTELWRSVRGIYRTVLRRLNARLDEEQITFPQYNVLLEISRNGPLPMRRLGDLMLVAPANVTGLVDRMERKGYVIRKRDKADRRLYLIEMTSEGGRKFKGISIRFRQYTRSLGSGLTEGELADTLSALRKIMKKAEAAPGL